MQVSRMASLINSISLVILVCFLVLNYNGVGGDRRLSKKEDFELEKQLKLHNKPAIKTIQTEHGDIYDCVEFYKQPAFDHPLLKNHSFDYFQMRPSSVPKKMRGNKESATNIKPISIGLQDGGCPFGTVPIKRVTRDDLIRIKSFSKKYGSKYGVINPEFPGNHFAVVRTKYDPLTKYNGGGGTLNIYNPLVGAQQYSASRLKIQNGPDYIIVGWMVFPALYGDNKTRLFTLLDSGPGGCYHGFCSGFIAINPSIPIGWVFDKVSTRGGPQYGIEILVFRDTSTGNWWIAINNNGESYIQIGYWPKEIFIGLADLATLVEWGGEVFSAVNVPSPKMGSGEYPIENTQFDAYYANITTLNAASESVEAVTEEYSDVDSYRVIDKGNVEGSSNHIVLYGGPGGYIEP